MKGPKQRLTEFSAWCAVLATACSGGGSYAADADAGAPAAPPAVQTSPSGERLFDLEVDVSGLRSEYTTGPTDPSRTLALRLNGKHEITVKGDGVAVFAQVLADGADYDVTIASKPDSLPCHVASGRGVFDKRTDTHVSVACGLRTVAVGRAHTCVVTNWGALHCWGDNSAGQTAGSSPKTPVAGLDAVGSVHTGDSHTCVVSAQMAGGAAHCWGSNARGQAMGSAAGTPVSSLRQLSGLATGGAHNCAWSLPRSLWCWGDDSYGQIEHGDAETPRGSEIRTMALGGQHSCAVLNTATHCWGRNDSGQAPALVKPPGGGYFDRISAGATHTCAVHLNGLVYCWGDDSYGQVAGSSTNAPVPGLSDVWQVAAGERHTCVVMNDRTVRCWGADDFGQSAGSSPTQGITALTDAVGIAAGANHTCAILIDGTVRCWGDNSKGQTAGSSTTEPVAM